MIGAILAAALAVTPTPPDMARVWPTQWPTHTITGWGDYPLQSCGQWTGYVAANHDHGVAGAWVSGYLSRAATAQDRDILGETDFPVAMAWLDNWCGAHPLDRVGNGVVALEIELTKRAIANETNKGRR